MWASSYASSQSSSGSEVPTWCQKWQCGAKKTEEIKNEASTKEKEKKIVFVEGKQTSSIVGDSKYVAPGHTKEAMMAMSIMRANGMLTDLRLEVGKEIFNVHRIVLASSSPYFKAMFTSGCQEMEAHTIRLQGVCPTVMHKLLNFIYTGEISVNELSICQILPAATMFQVSAIVEACCAFLENQLDPSNVIGIANFAQQHGCQDLYRAAKAFIQTHFAQVTKEEEFLQVSPCQLIDLIQNDRLNINDEREVYEAVVRWVRADEETRRPKMEAILGAVRCQFLSPSYIVEQMAKCDLLEKAPACREYLAKIFKELSLHIRPGVKERKPASPCVIFVAGGYGGVSIDHVERYCGIEKIWTNQASLTHARSGLGGAILGGLFYVIGGRTLMPGTNSDCQWVDVYDPAKDEWEPRQPMLQRRTRHGVAALDGCIYAVGGSQGKLFLNSVERYDPSQDKWSFLAPMASPRVGVAVAVVNRLLYAIGGFDGRQRLSSVECYHPERDEWIQVSPCSRRKSGAGCAAFEHYIYVAGGFDGDNQLAALERYDTEKDVWTSLSPMISARSAFQLVVLDSKLYAIGRAFL
ncbi:hypothetical protein QYM36_008134 [Artemia franciscana]|uniref:Kelch-like protein diablo n=1 Tax=Artemia franciscana TaxID=6661 RepID=A0AA88LEF9_ARTSF|nr:hypothetical protein QYM36_008134 [Artemia franciscana]